MRRSATDAPLDGQLVASERPHMAWAGGVVDHCAYGLLACYFRPKSANLGLERLEFVARNSDALVVVTRCHAVTLPLPSDVSGGKRGHVRRAGLPVESFRTARLTCEGIVRSCT